MIQLNNPISNLTSREVKGTDILRVPELDETDYDFGEKVHLRAFYYKGIIFYFEKKGERDCKEFNISLGGNYLFPYIESNRYVIIEGKSYPLVTVDFLMEHFKESHLFNYFDKYTSLESITLEGLMKSLYVFLIKLQDLNDKFLKENVNKEEIIEFLLNNIKEVKENLNKFKEVSWWKMTAEEMSSYLEDFKVYKRIINNSVLCLSKIGKGECKDSYLKNLKFWINFTKDEKKNEENYLFPYLSFKSHLRELESLYKKYKLDSAPKDPNEGSFNYSRKNDRDFLDLEGDIHVFKDYRSLKRGYS